MSASVVQSKVVTHVEWQDGVAEALPGAVTGGNQIIVLVGWSYLGCPPTLTDNLGNSYSELGSHTHITGGGTGEGSYTHVFIAPVTTGGVPLITLHASCGNARMALIAECSGLISSPYLTDAAALSTSNATDATTAGTLSSIQTGDLILACFSRFGLSNTGSVAGSGYTGLGLDAGSPATNFAEWKLAASTSETPVCTSDATPSFDVGGISVALRASAGSSTQVAYPVSDISAGSWTPSTGTDLFATIDETVASDTDYDQSATTPSNDTMEVKLTSLTTPATTDPVTMTIRHRVH